MKKYITIISIIVFIGMLTLPTVIWSVVMSVSPETIAAWDYDLGEKRDKTELPGDLVVDGNFAELENYYNDRVPFRSILISVNRWINSRAEAVYRENWAPALAAWFYKDESYLLPITAGDMVLFGRDNWLYYLGDDSLAYYRGANLLSEEKLQEYLELTVQLKELCDERGIRLQLMIVPNKEQVYPEHMPSYTFASEMKRVPLLVEYLRKNADVNIIYPLEELKAAKQNWQVYYRYDTHWNSMGALIGTQALLQALGMEKADPADWGVEEYDMSGEDLLLLGGLDAERYPKDVRYAVTYKPQVRIIEKEGGDSSSLNDILYSTSDSKNRCNMVMLFDSFRFEMEPYLQKEFSNCIITQWGEDAYHVRDFVPEADVLVIAAVERYDYKIFDTIKILIEILS